MRYLAFGIACVLVSLLSITCFAVEFPNRDKYPDVNIISLTDMKSGVENGEFLFIDLRSRVEFEAIHIKNAVNLPYGHAKFTYELNKISKEKPNKKLILYDNGHGCIRVYKAAEDAYDFALIQNAYAFDAGIDTWARAYPSETILMGEVLTNSKQQLLTAEQINQKKIDIENFRTKAANSNTVVIDSRDPIQRKHKVPGLEKAMLIPLNKLVENILSKGFMKDNQLLVFDQVGGQVNWLMYYLVDKGYTDFYFLDGGATSVLKDQEYRMDGGILVTKESDRGRILM